jgi:hypothetical protein
MGISLEKVQVLPKPSKSLVLRLPQIAVSASKVSIRQIHAHDRCTGACQPSQKEQGTAFERPNLKSGFRTMLSKDFAESRQLAWYL